MTHVLVVGHLHDAGHAMLDSAPGVRATYADGSDESCYAHLVHDADALLIRTQPVTAAVIDAAPRLRIVSRHGVGYDSIDLDALNARGIPLVVCGDVNSVSVAEHALMLMLAASKRAMRADAAVRHGDWSWRGGNESRELHRKNLLVVGYGRVGRHLARMAAGLGMNIRAYSPGLLARGWPEGPVSPVEDLHEGLAWADVVSLSAPKTDKPLLDTPEFAAMKRGAVLVNIARGGLISEPALVDALETGRVGAAGLDVFAEEPLPPGHPLTTFDQVLLSPHIAGVTAEAAERMAVDSVRNVLDFLDGRLDPGRIVNRAQI